jgi:hypothetical protein
LDQENDCAWFSTCRNDGETEDTETGSNSQSNRCSAGSNCENTGTNNHNTCVATDCTNGGTDTTVIGQGAGDCSNGADGGKRICQGPRTIDYDKDEEITNLDQIRLVRSG